MKRSIAVLLLFSLVIAFSGCFYSNHDYEQDYDKDWIIGKTAAEITERYGTFDMYFLTSMYYDDTDGYTGVYYLSDNTTRRLIGLRVYGDDLWISFDNDHVAKSIWVRSLGAGG